MATLSTTDYNYPPTKYGYQIIMGFHFGPASTLFMAINLVVTQ